VYPNYADVQYSTYSTVAHLKSYKIRDDALGFLRPGKAGRSPGCLSRPFISHLRGLSTVRLPREAVGGRTEANPENVSSVRRDPSRKVRGG
jgi:hypothetical protein